MVRHALGILLVVGALSAFAGGVYAMTGAPGVPLEWLERSPFVDYRIPGLILFVAVGGAFLVAAVAVLGRARFASVAATAAAAVVLVWLAVQIAFIGWVSWLQPATLAAAVAILLLAARLPVLRSGRPAAAR